MHHNLHYDGERENRGGRRKGERVKNKLYTQDVTCQCFRVKRSRDKYKVKNASNLKRGI